MPRKEIGRYYKKVQYIHDISEIDAPVSKVTVCDFKGAENNSFPALSDVRAPFKATLAGYMWTDLSLAATNKGRGLAALQKIMVFHRMKPWFSETISMIMK